MLFSYLKQGMKIFKIFLLVMKVTICSWRESGSYGVRFFYYILLIFDTGLVFVVRGN